MPAIPVLKRRSESTRYRREWLQMQAVVVELATIQVMQRGHKTPSPTDALIRARLSDALRALEIDGYLVLLRRDQSGPLRVAAADGVRAETALDYASRLARHQPAHGEPHELFADLGSDPGPLGPGPRREGSMALIPLSPDGIRDLGALMLTSHRAHGISAPSTQALAQAARSIALAADLSSRQTQTLDDLPERRASDPPTDRDGFLRALGDLSRRADQNGTSLTVAVVQVDALRRLLAESGAEAGTAVLRQVGRSLSKLLRTSDVVGRLDGGRFVAVLGDCDAAGASRVADKLRGAAAELSPAGASVVGVSIGLATRAGPGEDAQQLLAAAERQLEQAVEAGGDRTACRSSAPGIDAAGH